jgi:hypothetical protein
MYNKPFSTVADPPSAADASKAVARTVINFTDALLLICNINN